MSVHVGAVLINEDGRIVPHVTLRTDGHTYMTAAGARGMAEALLRWTEVAELMAGEANRGTLLGELALSDAEGEA